MEEKTFTEKMAFEETLCNRETSVFLQELLFVSCKSLGQAVLGSKSTILTRLTPGQVHWRSVGHLAWEPLG